VGLTVLHVAQSSEYGLGRYLVDLVAAQRAEGWDASVAGDPAAAIRPAVEAWKAWRASREPGPSTWAEARALRRIVDEVGPDVVHLHSSKAGLAGRVALRGRRPTIFQPHAWSFLAVHGATRVAAVTWERWAARWAAAVVCGSEAERAAGERAGIRAEWRVVPNAVDVDRFSPGDQAEARRQLGLPLDPPLVVCAGRLAVAQKGQDVLLRAWPAVADRCPGARLVLVGDGPDRAGLEAQAPPSVAFAGEQDGMATWFRAADVVVQPSRYETLSLSVLEAMACGRPVVVSNAIGMREAVGDDGAVVPVGDADGLAAAVVMRLRDPALAAAEGRARRERAVARYSSAAWASELLVITRDVAAR
jgi:glycosyltransferase involved in cell wall biosynthesis